MGQVFECPFKVNHHFDCIYGFNDKSDKYHNKKRPSGWDSLSCYSTLWSFFIIISHDLGRIEHGHAFRDHYVVNHSVSAVQK